MFFFFFSFLYLHIRGHNFPDSVYYIIKRVILCVMYIYIYADNYYLLLLFTGK